MNENLKTLGFVVVAAAVALVAWVSIPSPLTDADEDFRNKPLNPDFTNPLDAASLEIMKYDEAKAAIVPFKVAEVDYKGKTRWSIPSHENYPADAKNQMATAGAALVGLTIIDKVSDNEGDQEEYGVVDPDGARLGAAGIGEKVVMRDKNGKELLALIVGKQVPDRPDLRYVRRVGESHIFTVEAKTDKLSTKFEDWIEPNLLQFSPMDLKDIRILDYISRLVEQGLGIEYRGRMNIAYNDAGEPKWTMAEDEKYVGGKWKAMKMAADQEVNAAKLDELTGALDNLKIVDVNRKPAGLRDDLKVAADFTSNKEAVDSLQDRGFFAAQAEDGTTQLYSNEGETRLVMKNGVEYVLRFGQITGDSATGKDAAKKDKAKDAKKDKKATGLNRYLFIMAEFNKDAIPKPQLEQYIPPVKVKGPEKKPADEKKPDAPKPNEKKADEKKPEEKKADAKKPDEKKPEAKKPEADKKTEAEEKAEKAERARIDRDNKRKQDEYDRQVADGKKKVKELNARFADWYYVISDDVYRKIHLSRDEIVTKKAKKQAGKGVEGMPPGMNIDPAQLKEMLKNAAPQMPKQGPGGK
jgi:hypothetical protein